MASPRWVRAGGSARVGELATGATADGCGAEGVEAQAVNPAITSGRTAKTGIRR